MYILQWLLNEKIVLGILAVVFSLLMIWCLKLQADKEIIGTFGTLASMCTGALTRGITHQGETHDAPPKG